MFVVILAAIVAVLLFYLYVIHKEQRDARSPKEEPGRRTKAKTRDTKTAASPTVSERVQSQIKPNESTTPGKFFKFIQLTHFFFSSDWWWAKAAKNA